jgi:hypothetical protein
MSRGVDVGTLYILTNTDRSLAKLGLTRIGTPGKRAADYGRVHGIAWQVYWSAPTRNVGSVEAACHRALAAHRFVIAPLAHEVFHVTPQAARAIAERHVIPPDGLPWRLRLPRAAIGTAFRWAVGAAGLALWIALAGHG